MWSTSAPLDRHDLDRLGNCITDGIQAVQEQDGVLEPGLAEDKLEGLLEVGDGAIEVNKRALDDYFPRATHRTLALSPLKVADAEGRYDLRVRVHGAESEKEEGKEETGVRAKRFAGLCGHTSSERLAGSLGRGDDA